MCMVSVREVLNKIRWTGDMQAVLIWYVHRGAPDDMKVVDGKHLSEVGRSFLLVDGSVIPHHRVFRIMYHGEIVFDRKLKI